MTTSRTPASPRRSATRTAGGAWLAASVYNAETSWLAFAAARGHRVIDAADWLVVDSGKDTGGTRVILRGPITTATQHSSLNRLVEGVSRPVVVEDPFATIDLQSQGLVPRSLSVMVAGPFSPAEIPPADQPEITVREVQGDEGRLLDADRIVVEGFPLPAYQPYLQGLMLPDGLLAMQHISVFLAEHLGRPCGACMTVKDAHGVGGVYWVAVLPEHRRAGVGRSLMLAAMHELTGLPMVLCATKQGKPLYRKLGFETALESSYWGAGSPT